MTERSPSDTDTHTAELHEKTRWRLSAIWLVPVAAIAIGGWLLYDNFASRGPEITLTIQSAEGLQAGSTKLKVHSVDVGEINKIALSSNYRGAVLTVQMDPGTAGLLGQQSKFWVVKPRIGLQGISGLSTLLSGAYIQLQPTNKPSAQRRFAVSDNPPPVSAGVGGVTIRLLNSSDNTLSVGDPIVYRGQNVGRIEASQFSVPKRLTIYKVFIRKPFSELITRDTQFWLRSGVNVDLGANGFQVQLGSLRSLLTGGITFGIPDGMSGGELATNGESYKLYATENAAVQDRFKFKLRYVVLLNDSVRGLAAGAPVDYRGLRVGTVEKVPSYFKGFSDKSFSGFRIPVLIALEPQRKSLSWAHGTRAQWRQRMLRLFSNGLRATIKTSNLLTGAAFIDLSFDKHAKPYHEKTVGRFTVFPSEPSQFASIQQELSNLAKKLDDIQFGQISKELQGNLRESQATLASLHATVDKINHMLSQPGAQKLPQQLDSTLKTLQQTLAGFQNGTPAYENINQTLQHLNQVLDNLAPLSQTLSNRPNALIFGSPRQPDPTPRAKP